MFSWWRSIIVQNSVSIGESIWELWPLKSQIFANFHIWSLFLREQKEITNHYRTSCSAQCNLSLFKILLQSDNLCGSYGPWNDDFCKFLHIVIIIERMKGDKWSLWKHKLFSLQRSNIVQNFVQSNIKSFSYILL